MAPLTPAQTQFLDKPHYAVLTTVNPDGSPQSTVIWYLLDPTGDVRFSFGGAGIKARNLKHDPRVTLTIEDGSRYLTLRGRVALEPADLDLRRRLAVRYRGPENAEEYLKRRPDAPRLSGRLVVDGAYGQGIG